MLWDPVRFLESCPSSDGACAVVFTDEAGGRAAAAAGRPPAWILGTSVRSEPASFPGRDPVRPAARGRLRRRRLRAGRHHRPAAPDRLRRAVRAVLAGTSRCGSRPTTSPTRARAGRWSTTATTALDGAFPVNPSGGVLSSQPDRRVGAAALRRGGDPGARHGRRAPGRRGEGRARPGLRREQPVLQHVGGRVLAAAVRLTGGRGRHPHRRVLGAARGPAARPHPRGDPRAARAPGGGRQLPSTRRAWRRAARRDALQRLRPLQVARGRGARGPARPRRGEHRADRRGPAPRRIRAHLLRHRRRVPPLDRPRPRARAVLRGAPDRGRDRAPRGHRRRATARRSRRVAPTTCSPRSAPDATSAPTGTPRSSSRSRASRPSPGTLRYLDARAMERSRRGSRTPGSTVADFRLGGHAVRSLYFASGIAEVALATGDRRTYATRDPCARRSAPAALLPHRCGGWPLDGRGGRPAVRAARRHRVRGELRRGRRRAVLRPDVAAHRRPAGARPDRAAALQRGAVRHRRRRRVVVLLPAAGGRRGRDRDQPVGRRRSTTATS